MIRRKKMKEVAWGGAKGQKQKDKRKETKCVKRVGTAICAARTPKMAKYTIILLSYCILNIFMIPLTYLIGIIIHVFASLNNEENCAMKRLDLKTLTFF